MPNFMTNFRASLADRRMVIIFLLGFASGLPLLLTASTLGVWLLEEGLSKSAIGALSLVGLPYTLKFLWAPFFDQMQIPKLSQRLGRRRSFMLVCQMFLGLSLVGLALSDPRSVPLLTAFFALSTSFFSASQDIVIDAFRVEILDEKSYGTGAATVVFGYRIGMLVAGAGALYLASFFSWHMVYLFMAALIFGSMLVTMLSKEPIPQAALRQEPSQRSLRTAILMPLQEFMAHKHWFLIVLLIIFYKLGDAFLTSMSTIFFLENGFSKIEIANVVKVFGLIATLSGGFFSALMAKRIGIMRSMIVCGVIHMIANLIFVIQAFVGYNIPMLIITIGCENVTAGMTGVALVAYISHLCNGPHTATQYAVLSSVMAIGRSLLSSSAGYFATIFGWPLFFMLSSAITLPALVILLYFMRSSKASEDAVAMPLAGT